MVLEKSRMEGKWFRLLLSLLVLAILGILFGGKGLGVPHAHKGARQDRGHTLTQHVHFGANWTNWKLLDLCKCLPISNFVRCVAVES